MTARDIAFDVLRRVEEGGAYASRALDAALASAGKLEPREAGLATELVYGTLRRALSLDAALAPLSSRPLAQVDPAARVALRLGAYELLHLGTPPHAAVSQAVALAKKVEHGRAAGFVNAVLRKLAAQGAPKLPEGGPAARIAAKEALPLFMAEEWVAWFGAEEAEKLAAAMNAPAPLTLRSAKRDEVIARLIRAGVGAKPTRLSPDGIRIEGASVREVARALEKGPAWQVQDEAAQLVSRFLAPAMGARVLDACAAPGGKTFHLAELVGPEGRVVAIELHPRKADELRRAAAERGLANVEVICADAAKPIPGLAEGSFDFVLADAPCAGLGTLRRHPELKLRRTAEDIARLAAIQEALLASCARYAKPGAPIVYALCSLSRAEGPEVVRRSGLARLPPPPGFPAEALSADGDLLTLPHRHDCDGFYAARLVRPVSSG